MSTNLPTYTQEFKQQVVEEVLQTGNPKAQIARKYGVSIGSVKNWVKKYHETQQPQRSHQSNKPEDKTRDHNESRIGSINKSARELELEREVQRLRDELSFVRKVAAYVARGAY